MEPRGYSDGGVDVDLIHWMLSLTPEQEIGRDGDDARLLPHSTEVRAGDDIFIRMPDLETLIRIKEEAGGEKDRAVLPIHRRLLEEKS
jgi:hypothetical protein